MSRNGAGIYSPVVAGGAYPATPGTLIESAKFNTQMTDIATALTESIARDGQTTITADIPFNGNKITGLGAGTAASHAANLSQVQDASAQWCGTAGGTANSLTLTPSPAITAYAPGRVFRFKSGASANTGPTQIAISGLGPINVQLNGAALTAGDIEANKWYQITFSDTVTAQLQKIGISDKIALLVSPALTGSPTAPTQSAGDSSTKIATTAFVSSALSGTNRNGIINGCMRVAQILTAPNLSTSAQYGKVDMWTAWASGGAVSSGTITQDAAAAIGSSGHALKVAGATLTGSGVVSMRQRIEAIDAIRFKNQTATFSARVLHDVGSDIIYTIVIRKPTAADNYASVTTIGSQAIAVASGTETLISYSVAMGDCSNGIEIEIQAACGAVTTKNFSLADVQFVLSSEGSEFRMSPYNQVLDQCLRHFEVINGATSGSNTIGVGFYSSTTVANISFTLYPKRTKSISIGYRALTDFYFGGTLQPSSLALVNPGSSDNSRYYITGAVSGATANIPAQLVIAASIPEGYLSFDARL